MLKIFNHSVQRLFPDSQLPFRILDKNLDDLYRMLFFQNLQSFTIRALLFCRVRGYTSKFYPQLGLKRRLGLLNTANGLKLVFALFGHKRHFSLPNWFLQVFRQQLQCHVSDFLTLFEQIILPSSFEVKLSQKKYQIWLAIVFNLFDKLDYSSNRFDKLSSISSTFLQLCTYVPYLFGSIDYQYIYAAFVAFSGRLDTSNQSQKEKFLYASRLLSFRIY